MVFNGRPVDGFIPYDAFDSEENTLEIMVR